MKLTNKRLVGGVIALLAIVSLAQTQAILQIAKASNVNKTSTLAKVSSEDQTAQVLSTTSSRCVEVLPVEGTEHSIDYPGAAVSENGQVLDYNHTFFVHFKVKNKCNSDIYVLQDLGMVMPGVYEDTLGLFPGEIQEYNPSFEYVSPSPIVPATDIGFYYSGVWGGYPYVGNLDIPLTNMPGVNFLYNSSAPSATSARIPALSERYFTFQSMVQIDTNDFPEVPKAYRMALKKIRWFSQNSYADNTISASEVKTYVMPASLSKSLTTSYITYWNNQSVSGFKNLSISSDASKETREALEKMGDLYKTIKAKK